MSNKYLEKIAGYSVVNFSDEFHNKSPKEQENFKNMAKFSAKKAGSTHIQWGNSGPMEKLAERIINCMLK